MNRAVLSSFCRWALPTTLGLFATAMPASAHTSESGFVLLLPTGYYLAGGTLAVLISFLLVFLLPAQSVERFARARLPLVDIRLPPALATSAVCCLILTALLLAGFLGSRDPRANPLPLVVWSLWWGAFPFLQAVFGDLWRRCNPWLAPYRLIARDKPVMAYPSWLGHWPAILGFLCFTWFELVDLAPDDPARLAKAILAYGSLTLIAMYLFGAEIWLERGDPFSFFLRLVAHLSPIVCQARDNGHPDRRSLSLCWPGAQLFELKPLPVSGAIFVLLTLSAISFDGLNKTFWWLSLGGINPLEFPGRSAVIGLNTLGILGLWLLLVAAYFIAIQVGRWINPALAAGHAAGLLVVSIIPISLGYHFAHYLTFLMVDLQYAVKAIADPFALGWDLFGLGRYHVTTSFLSHYHSVVTIWNLQAGATVLGHLVAVAVAHVLTARLGGDRWRAPFGQVPLAALMVLYTLFGLWLLAAPKGG